MNIIKLNGSFSITTSDDRRVKSLPKCCVKCVRGSSYGSISSLVSDQSDKPSIYFIYGIKPT